MASQITGARYLWQASERIGELSAPNRASVAAAAAAASADELMIDKRGRQQLTNCPELAIPFRFGRAIGRSGGSK